ncbi:uncharacterized protein LOC62_02G002940 [Vanrija pseudolonga]|uniref:Ubiquitin-like domain-containing protein n=1 Tax=Vanrija pseudolonga TaxID=143232 RepID=A0AAF0Y9G0_9TREE|nr:hypothetical protein LOC62_02G002940 [Vanrija pseudolonga]
MSSSNTAPQDVKPDWAVLDGREKPTQTGVDDDAALRDIKPVIPGLEKQGIDFVKTRPGGDIPRQPGHIEIFLDGTKEGVHYKRDLIVFPQHTVLQIKKYLHDYYGYKIAKLRLIYDGSILANDDTMGRLEVEEGDTFDVYLERTPARVSR